MPDLISKFQLLLTHNYFFKSHIAYQIFICFN